MIEIRYLLLIKLQIWQSHFKKDKKQESFWLQQDTNEAGTKQVSEGRKKTCFIPKKKKLWWRDLRAAYKERRGYLNIGNEVKYFKLKNLSPHHCPSLLLC